MDVGIASACRRWRRAKGQYSAWCGPTVFTSGAGIITCAAQNQITAFPVMPSCAEITNSTAEVSNTYYTTVPAGASGTSVQNFRVTGQKAESGTLERLCRGCLASSHPQGGGEKDWGW